MKEIQITNDLELKVYINGKPDLLFMPKEVLDEFCSALLSLLEGETAL